MPMPTKIDATIELEVDELLNSLLLGLPDDKIIDLVIELDRRAGSWDVTAPLCAHFARLAEPHFQHLARAAKEAMASSTPKRLKTGEWHLPLIDDEDRAALSVTDLIKVSVGRCARVSYLTHDGRRDHAADIELHDRLVVQQPAHAAPAEHVAMALDWPDWYDEWPAYYVEGTETVSELQGAVLWKRKQEGREGPETETLQAEAALAQMRSGNFLGFRQYRKTLPNEHIGGLVP